MVSSLAESVSLLSRNTCVWIELDVGPGLGGSEQAWPQYVRLACLASTESPNTLYLEKG